MNLSNLELERLGPALEAAVGTQISHGLNLVLKLKTPAEMPLLLAEIHKRQRKIDSGLGELNFVHFARFLPTYDNAALQVITEFDGPLAPYVLDFAIEIGDIFDLLLSFTQGTEHIVPIAEHPAEFLAFVVEHNTVTVIDQKILDWPLYSAYPDLTMLEIAGPRGDLPVPKSDRCPTVVDRDDVQGNILQGFAAERVRHFVLNVIDAFKARTWLADRATPDGDLPSAVPKVTSYAPWTAGTKPDLMVNVGLTYDGMTALGIRPKWRDLFPEPFVQGALKRAQDNFDIDRNDPASWRLGGPAQVPFIHSMVSLYHAAGAEAAFEQAAAALIASLADGGLELLASYDATSQEGKTWFGYRDSIANPRVAVPCPVPGAHDDLQPAATPGEFILGVNYKNIYGGSSLGTLPEALATNGAFCAVRMLAQDPYLFDRTIDSEADRLGVAPDWLAAKLMGRWYEGAPLSLHPASPSTDPVENLRNDFDYAPSYEYPGTTMDHDGGRCPIGAHIRRANPRTARVAGARYARRLMRRGMHYEIPDDHGRREVGLFGLFMCADLERQFEFIQRQWLNGDRFAAGLRGTRDPFVGTPPPEGHRFEIPMASGPALEVWLPQFVQTRGSLYLFMPGLRALRELDRFSKSDPVVPAGPAPSVAPALQQAAPSIDGISPLVALLRQLQQALHDLGATMTDDDLLEIARASVGGPRTTAAPTMPSQGRGLVFEPRRRDFQIDPYPTFKQFRRRERVHHSPLFGGWFAFGYDDVAWICNDDSSFSAAELGTKELRGLFTLDDPEHAAVRKRVELAWRQGAVDTAMFVQRSIDRTLASISGRDCFDLVDDLARPVPRDVYFDILGGAGIDPGQRALLDKLARTVMQYHDHTLDPLQQSDGLVAAIELGIRLGLMLVDANRPNSPYQGTFLDYLARVVDWRGGAFDAKVAVATLVNLTVAGYMSVEFLLATGIRRLLMDDGTFWNMLKQDPGSAPKLLREMRRTSHALSVIDRYAKLDITMSGVRIPRGGRVFGVLASANRDELVYGATADVFDPKRTFHKPHLGLGAGAHDCMGRSLEKMISEPTLCRLVDQMPDLRLQSTAQPPWFTNFYFRSFHHLKVSMR